MHWFVVDYFIQTQEKSGRACLYQRAVLIFKYEILSSQDSQYSYSEIRTSYSTEKSPTAMGSPWPLDHAPVKYRKKYQEEGQAQVSIELETVRTRVQCKAVLVVVNIAAAKVEMLLSVKANM